MKTKYLKSYIILFSVLFLTETVLFSAPTAKNFLKDGGMETLGKSDSPWKLIYSGAPSQITSREEDGNRFLHVKTEKNGKSGMYGAKQVLIFDPPIYMPIRFGGRARVESEVKALEGNRHDFNIYIDAFYEDDSPLWGARAHFRQEERDWHETSDVIWPEKPIKKVEIFVLFRDYGGEVSFDDIFFGELLPEMQNFRAVGGLTGEGSVAISGQIYWNPRFNKEPFSVELYQITDGKETAIPVDFQSDNRTFFVNVMTEKNAKNVGNTDSGTKKTFRICVKQGEKTTFEKIFTCDTASKIGCGTYSAPDLPYTLWLESSMKRVYLNTLPEIENLEAENTETKKTTENTPKNTTFSVQLDTARGESESFQIAVHSRVEIPRVSVTFSDFVSKDNPNAKISASTLEWQQVGYLKTPKIVEHPLEKNGMPMWYPDTLLPRRSGIVPANQTASFWVTVSIPPETMPGTYHGTVTWTPEMGKISGTQENGENAEKAENSVNLEKVKPVEIPVTVTVYPVTIPPEGHLGNAFALMDGFLEEVYEKTEGPISAERLLTLRRNFGEMMLRNRLTPEGDISRTEMPNVELLKEWKGRGLGKFNILNMVTPRGNAPWQCNAPVEFYTPEQKEKFLEQLRPYIEKLRKMGLSEQAYIYTFDERGDEYQPIMTDFFGMVKENFPEISTFTTAYFKAEPELMKKLNVDWACPLTSVYNLETARECRQNGQQVWSYICCGPGAPYANIMLRFPLIEGRILGWQAFEQEYDGLLYWGMNIWSCGNNLPMDPDGSIFWDWETSWNCGGTQIYGDGRLIYPGKDGMPIGCVRLANLRDGYEDYELLWQLNQKNPQLSRELCEKVIPDLQNFTRNPDVLKKQRRAVLEALAKP
ncbi:MAG: DUF4091 domain-containing protein [Planctomycetia bacterium]|nr:DUF4091 domain-containing protein [Planctomycetia bacterium]